MSATDWALERFGPVASDLQAKVAQALLRAHNHSERAHRAAGMKTHDTYGATMFVKQFEELNAQTQGLPGVEHHNPARQRFPYVVMPERRVALHLWRYGRDGNVTHKTAKLPAPVSERRRDLLTLTPHDPRFEQLTTDQALLTAEEIEEEAAAAAAVDRQIGGLGRVVTVAYASHPDTGVFGVVWGDAELEDPATGEMSWGHFEFLTMPDLGAVEAAEADASTKARPNLRVVDDKKPDRRRFDDGPIDDSFGGLRPRTPLEGLPSSEPEVSPDKASEADDGDDT